MISVKHFSCIICRKLYVSLNVSYIFFSVWVMAGIGCTGNIIVLLGRHFAPSSNIIHSLYLKNLALSDLLMGIYLIIIAVEDQYYRGVYLTYQYKWRHSNLCKLCGNVLIFLIFSQIFIKIAFAEFVYFRIFKYPIM